MSSNLSAMEVSISSPDITHFYSAHVYFAISLLLIVVGIVVNLIVITTYRFGENKKLVNNANTSVNALCINKIQQQGKKGALNRDPSVNLALLASTNTLAATTSVAHVRNLSLSIAVRRPQAANDSGGNRSSSAQKRILVDRNDTAFVTTAAGTAYQIGYKIRKTLCSYFIIGLGFCDLLICLLNMPFFMMLESGLFNRAIIELIMRRTRSHFTRTCACRFVYFFIQIPITVEIVILLTIALDRYLSVFRPIKTRYFFNKNMFKFTLMAHVAFSCLLSVPNFFFYEFVAEDVAAWSSGNSSEDLFFMSLSTLCPVYAPYAAYHTAYNVMLFVLFGLNLLVIIVCYMQVYKHVYKVSKHQRQDSFMVTNTLQYDKNYLNSR
jgi:hypothetical protein